MLKNFASKNKNFLSRQRQSWKHWKVPIFSLIVNHQTLKPLFYNVKHVPACLNTKFSLRKLPLLDVGAGALLPLLFPSLFRALYGCKLLGPRQSVLHSGPFFMILFFKGTIFCGNLILFKVFVKWILSFESSDEMVAKLYVTKMYIFINKR